MSADEHKDDRRDHRDDNLRRGGGQDGGDDPPSRRPRRVPGTRIRSRIRRHVRQARSPPRTVDRWVNRWRREFPSRYRDPYKGSTMMVLRGGRIDRQWGARTVARGTRSESSGAPGHRRAHGGRYMEVGAFAGSNEGGTHEESRSVGVRVAGRRHGVAGEVALSL